MSDTNDGVDQNPLACDFDDTSVFHGYLDIVHLAGDNEPWVWNGQDSLEPRDDWDLDVSGFENLFAVDGGLQSEPSPGAARLAQASSPNNAAWRSDRTALDCDAARMEASDVERILLDLLGDDTPITTYNPPVLPVIVPPTFEMETPDSISRVNLGAPAPPSNDPSPDFTAHVLSTRTLDLEEVPMTWAELTSKPSDVRAVEQSVVARLDLVPGPSVPQRAENEDLDLAIAPMLKTVLKPCPEVSRYTDNSITKSRCAPCRFSGSACDGAVGSICSRCRRLELLVDEKPRRQAKEWLDKVSQLVTRPQVHVEPTAESLSLPKIMMFELVESQLLLVALRAEVDGVSGLAPKTSLQFLFSGNLLCHVDDKAVFDQCSTTSSTIAIKRLATTVSAANDAAGIVAPALNGIQLDTFIDRRRPYRKVDHLAAVDQETLTIAWRCSYWITVLLSWDSNDIYLDRHSTANLPGAKTLVLELTYSIAHRIQELIKQLCDRVTKMTSRSDNNHNPVALCCALWIVFAATHKFEKRNFNASSLKNLGLFLTMLHERSRAAIHSINQYKWLASVQCCSYARDDQGLFAKLIADAKTPKSTVSFAFEQHLPEELFFLRGPSRLSDNMDRPHTYSEVLEAKVPFLEDTDLFLGHASNRNFGVPRPSNCEMISEPRRTPPPPPPLDPLRSATGAASTSCPSLTQDNRLESQKARFSPIDTRVNDTALAHERPLKRHASPPTRPRPLGSDTVGWVRSHMSTRRAAAKALA